MPENEKAGAYAPAFYICEKSFREMLLVRLWKDDAEGSKEGCRPGCSLLEKVFQRFALQVVPSDIFFVVFAKSLRREK